MQLLSSKEWYEVWVDSKYDETSGKTHVAFYSRWPESKDPERIEKKFEVFLDSDGLLDLIKALDQ